MADIFCSTTNMPFGDRLFQVLPLGVVDLTGTLDVEYSIVEELTSGISSIDGGIVDSGTYLIHLFRQ